MKLFPKQTVDLVEEDEWQKQWDPAGKIMEWASDSAFDMYRELVLRGGDCKNYVSDMFPSLSDTKLDIVCEFLSQYDDRLEETRHAIEDAFTWAFELAYMPEDNDLESALGSAIETVAQNSYFQGDLIQGTMQWHKTNEDRLLESVLGLVYYKRPRIKGRPAYHRLIVFDFGKSPLLNTLSRGPFFIKREFPEGPKEWSPYITAEGAKAEAQKDLKDELSGIKDDILSEFWKELDKEMSAVDVFNRVDASVQWDQVLEEEARLKGVRKEIREFLKEIKDEL